MKALVRARPDLAKPIVMPNRSLEGRLVHGVEITQNVNARRRQARLLPDGRAPRARVALGRDADGVRHRPGQELRQGRAHHRPGEPRAHDRRAGDQRGRLQPLPRGGDRSPGRGQRRSVLGRAVERPARAVGHLQARRPAEHQRAAGRADRDQPGQHRGDPRRRPDRLRLQAAQLPHRAEQAAGAPGECADAGQPHARHRPQPQLRRLLGRPRRQQRPGRRHLPRQRAVLRARDPERAPDRVQPPGHDADHQPHLLQPGAARRRASRPRGRRPTRASTRRSATRWPGQRLRQPVRLRALRHHGHDRGLELLRSPAASASPSRSGRTSSTRPTSRSWPSTRATPRPRSTASRSTATRAAATARRT